MSGGVRDVFAEHNESGGAGTAYLLEIKMNAYRGGAVQNIYVRESVLHQTIRGIVNFDSNYKESIRFPNADVFKPDDQEHPSRQRQRGPDRVDEVSAVRDIECTIVYQVAAG